MKNSKCNRCASLPTKQIHSFLFTINLHADSLDIMRNALRTVPKDPGFTVSASAVEAQHAAINMLEALDDDHNTESRSIVEKLVNSLSTCTSAGRDRMWGLFYTTRTSPEFLSTWDKLMSLTLGKPASPIFFQTFFSKKKQNNSVWY